ncbi:phosphoglycerate kinase, partial [Candidatus Shapirobacteria bacterium CG_4_9_14_0_2_um_filter_39_11]
MKLPSVKNLSVTQKRVLLRTDYDVPLKLAQSAKCKVQSWRVTDATRIADSLPTINYLLSKQAKIIILSHLGRPEGRVVEELSLEPVANMLAVILKCQIVKQEDGWKIGEEIFLKENLRFNPEEEGNDPKFAQNLGSLGDFYVNDAFACSHRKHASVVGIPKFLPASRRAFGFDFLEEVKALTKIKDNPRRPVVVILGGVK